MADISQQTNIVVEATSDGDIFILPDNVAKRIRRAYVRNNYQVTLVIKYEYGDKEVLHVQGFLEEEENKLSIHTSTWGTVSCGIITPEDYQDDSTNVE